MREITSAVSPPCKNPARTLKSMPLSPEQEALCERLANGESTPIAAAFIRQQAHEIDDLWDRLSRGYALVRRRVPSTDDPRGDGATPGYAGRAPTTIQEVGLKRLNHSLSRSPGVSFGQKTGETRCGVSLKLRV